MNESQASSVILWVRILGVLAIVWTVASIGSGLYAYSVISRTGQQLAAAVKPVPTLAESCLQAKKLLPDNWESKFPECR